MAMFETNCAYCGKVMYAYAKSKTGELFTVYCSKVCESNAKHEKRFIDKKRLQ